MPAALTSPLAALQYVPKIYVYVSQIALVTRPTWETHVESRGNVIGVVRAAVPAQDG